MRIQLLSDLHLEVERMSNAPDSDRDGDLYQFDFPADPTADALALVGDIGTTNEERLFEWIRAQLARFKIVFFVPGNHEAFRSTMDESRERLMQFAAECAANAETAESQASDQEQHPSKAAGRFVLLDRTRYDVSPTLTMLGCTLWAELDPTQLDAVFHGVGDFKHIRGFTLDTFQALHAQDVAWLEAELAAIARDEPARQVVVMTHHAPTKQGTSNPLYEGSPTGSAFATEMVGGACWTPQVKVWMYGHTHWNCDVVREGVRIVSNQRGYKNGSPGFELVKVIEV